MRRIQRDGLRRRGEWLRVRRRWRGIEDAGEKRHRADWENAHSPEAGADDEPARRRRERAAVCFDGRGKTRGVCGWRAAAEWKGFDDVRVEGWRSRRHKRECTGANVRANCGERGCAARVDGREKRNDAGTGGTSENASKFAGGEDAD